MYVCHPAGSALPGWPCWPGWTWRWKVSWLLFRTGSREEHPHLKCRYVPHLSYSQATFAGFRPFTPMSVPQSSCLHPTEALPSWATWHLLRGVLPVFVPTPSQRPSSSLSVAPAQPSLCPPVVERTPHRPNRLLHTLPAHLQHYACRGAGSGAGPGPW